VVIADVGRYRPVSDSHGGDLVHGGRVVKGHLGRHTDPASVGAQHAATEYMTFYFTYIHTTHALSPEG
jgi:hypothetical protein